MYFPLLKISKTCYNFLLVYGEFLNNEFIESDAEKMGGTPVFRGTRVPVQNLFDYLDGGDSLDIFLDDFPTVSRDQAIGVLEL